MAPQAAIFALKSTVDLGAKQHRDNAKSGQPDTFSFAITETSSESKAGALGKHTLSNQLLNKSKSCSYLYINMMY